MSGEEEKGIKELNDEYKNLAAKIEELRGEVTTGQFEQDHHIGLHGRTLAAQTEELEDLKIVIKDLKNIIDRHVHLKWGDEDHGDWDSDDWEPPLGICDLVSEVCKNDKYKSISGTIRMKVMQRLHQEVKAT